jgi:hypothetical protein
MNPLCLDLSAPPEISQPPYFSNDDRLGKFYYTIGIRTLKNGGGVDHFKTQKKKLNFGGDTHVTLNPKNPKPLNPKPGHVVVLVL